MEAMDLDKDTQRDCVIKESQKKRMVLEVHTEVYDIKFKYINRCTALKTAPQVK